MARTFHISLSLRYSLLSGSPLAAVPVQVRGGRESNHGTTSGQDKPGAPTNW